MLIVRKIPAPLVKTASRQLLGDNPTTWSSELMGLLFRQHEFLSDFQISVQILGQDEAAGYLYGLFLVSPPSNGSDMTPESRPYGQDPGQPGQPQAPLAGMGKEQQDKPPSVRIPIVVQERKACPFDVFIDTDGKFFPLTQTRLSATLFQNSPYRAVPKSAMDAGQTSMRGGMSTSAPDATSNPRYGGGTALDKVSHLIAAGDIDAFIAAGAADMELVHATSSNAKFATAVIKLASRETELQVHVDALSQALADADVLGTVVHKDAQGWSMLALGLTKEGAATLLPIRLERTSAQELPLQVRQQALSEGWALLDGGADAALPRVAADDVRSGMHKVATAERPGVYAVLDADGEAMRAAVLTDVITFDGRKTDLCLAMAPSGFSAQEKVAGLHCGELDLAAIVGEEPQGYGFFLLGDGRATVPVHIKLAEYKGANCKLAVEDDFGRRFLLHMDALPSNQLAFCDGNGFEVLFPKLARFVPVTKQTKGAYQTDTERLTKVASRQETANAVQLRVEESGDYGFFDADGERSIWQGPVQASVAALTLVGYGDSSAGAKEKLAAAAAFKSVRFVPQRALSFTVKQASREGYDAACQAVQECQDGLAQCELTQLALYKTAALMPSQNTVDAVLSLGFLSPENVSGYIDAIPELEEALAHVAEILIGVRLGVQDVPESSVTSAMLGLEKTIAGLKKFQIRLSLPTTTV